MTQTKYRTDTCGDLRMVDEGRDVVLAGWVQRVRKMGGMTFVDLRDRYGITQLVFSEDSDSSLCAEANKLGREYVVQAEGKVMKRSNLTEDQVRAIMATQASRKQRLAVADDVIQNDKSIEEVMAEVRVLHARYKKLAENLAS